MAELRRELRRRMRRADFLAATGHGVRRATRFFTVFVFERSVAGRARLGVTVTRKVGNAVRRNRIKRLAREWFRGRRGEFESCDLVLIAKRELPQSATFAEVRADLDAALPRRS
jgi:ribonuclease P protein component